MVYTASLVAFVLGLFLGGMFVRTSRYKPIIGSGTCTQRISISEVAGLFACVVIPNASRAVPSVVLETDKTLVFNHPRPKHKLHYIFTPKKDIKNIGELRDTEDKDLTDLFAAVAQIIREQQLKNYRVWTNGPEKQDVAYLHFHLGADEPRRDIDMQ